MSLIEQTGPYLADFGEHLTVEGDGRTVRAHLDQPAGLAFQVRGRSVTATVTATTADTLGIGDVLERSDGERFEIVGVRSTEDLAFRALRLQSRGYVVDVVADSARLTSLYLDEADQGYPVTTAHPELHDETVLELRAGSPAARPVFLVGAPAPAVIPAHARIDRAELWAYAAEAAAATWSTHRILQGYVSGQVSWLRYRTGARWATAGCGLAGTDYLAANYGSSGSIVEGWQRLAWGRDFSRLVEARKESGLGLVVRGGTGSAQLFSGEDAVAEGDRPYLRLYYSFPVG